MTGRNAGGKSSVVRWLETQGFESSSCSDSIRHWLTEQGIEITRDSLIDGGRTLRAEGGPGILAEMLLERIPEGSDHVIDSIRTPAEVAVLQTRADFWLIEVRASEEVRWERLSARGRAGDAETFEQFRTQEEAELEAADDSGQALLETAKQADIVIQNEGSVAELEADMGTLLSAMRSGDL
ncbi:MAG: hypothetical protein MK233_01175 [Candidatus Poseidoniales archaeon]|nr:hypothetical protein [Candidatus Poseidoniales archaeon]